MHMDGFSRSPLEYLSKQLSPERQSWYVVHYKTSILLLSQPFRADYFFSCAAFSAASCIRPMSAKARMIEEKDTAMGTSGLRS